MGLADLIKSVKSLKTQLKALDDLSPQDSIKLSNKTTNIFTIGNNFSVMLDNKLDTTFLMEVDIFMDESSSFFFYKITLRSSYFTTSDTCSYSLIVRDRHLVSLLMLRKIELLILTIGFLMISGWIKANQFA